VALGPDVHWKVVMEGVMEVGRYFILYEVKEVGLIPIGHIWTTQLVTPLKSHLSVLLCFLTLILMAFFPCFFQFSAVFRKPGEVSREITVFQHHVFLQLVWTSVGWLNHVFNVEKVKTIILHCKGVTYMPGLDEEVDHIQKPLLSPHYQKNFTAEKKAILY
jgi:hypothetical protein